ncbi:MAG TPA: response regulator [Candidatus Acidoferrales bacterium]|nr:response regulator [Candidatus Acidoferrales bacterium]
MGEQTGTETILLVEDAEPLRILVKEILIRYGYKVLDTENGDDAIRMARNFNGPIHLLLTDVVMPGMRGDQLARKLSGILPKMKVLYMSGYPNDGIVRQGIVPDGVSFLEKPFTRELLNRNIRQVLDQQ